MDDGEAISRAGELGRRAVGSRQRGLEPVAFGVDELTGSRQPEDELQLRIVERLRHDAAQLRRAWPGAELRDHLPQRGAGEDGGERRGDGEAVGERGPRDGESPFRGVERPAGDRGRVRRGARNGHGAEAHRPGDHPGQDRRARTALGPLRGAAAIDEPDDDRHRQDREEHLLHAPERVGDAREIGDQEPVVRARGGTSAQRRPLGDRLREEEPGHETDREHDRGRTEQRALEPAEPPERKGEDDIRAEEQDWNVEEDADAPQHGAVRALEPDPGIEEAESNQERPEGACRPAGEPVQAHCDRARDHAGEEDGVRDRVHEVVARRQERRRSGGGQGSQAARESEGVPESDRRRTREQLPGR